MNSLKYKISIKIKRARFIEYFISRIILRMLEKTLRDKNIITNHHEMYLYLKKIKEK